MAKTTSENKTNAMIIGVGTHPKYRNRSYASKCLIKICNELIREKKVLVYFVIMKKPVKSMKKLDLKK